MQSSWVIWTCRCRCTVLVLQIWPIWTSQSRRRFHPGPIFYEESNWICYPDIVLFGWWAPRCPFRKPYLWRRTRAIVKTHEHLEDRLDTKFLIWLKGLVHFFCLSTLIELSSVDHSAFSFLKILGVSPGEAHEFYCSPLMKRSLRTLEIDLQRSNEGYIYSWVFEFSHWVCAH